MEFLDDLDIKTEYLSEEHGLYKPVLDQSVAGILPAIVKHWNADVEPSELMVTNSDAEKRLEENFPSGYDNVVFLVCDALGAHHLREMGSILWDNMTTKGSVASSCFPTMTATVMTSLGYGLHPSRHGLVGYNIYNEHLGQVWNALNLRYRDNNDEIRMVFDNVSLDQLVDGMAMTELIKSKSDIPISFFTPDQLKPPGLDDILNPNLPRQTYSTPEDASMKLVQQLNRDVEHNFIALYIGYADHFGHLHGPESEYYRGAIRGIEQSIQQLLVHPKIQDGSTLVALTSDHGQVQLNHDISTTMTRDQWKQRRNEGILLSTSGRVIHAYAAEGKEELNRQYLEDMIGEKGVVIDNTTAIQLAGGFDKYAHRMGDYVAVCEDEFIFDVPEIVALEEEGQLNGQHGSLTGKELFVPFGIFGGQ